MTKGRTFEDKAAVRERVPLLIGLTGPSGGGKTLSALRLASGIQRVTGGEIFVIDTEARRALHYADRFRFRHVDFGAPFSALDYLGAIEHCVERGAGVIVVDSTSHEHEGPGGMLEFHEREVERISKLWRVKPAVAQLPAWHAPKRDRRKLINTVLQLPCNFIFCFRGKEKMKIKKGEDPVAMGYMAIAGDEFIFEMTINALLLPGANGVPTWASEEVGERQQIKRPGWAAAHMPDGQQLSEEMGERLARWAAGNVVRGVPELLDAYAVCTTPSALGSLEVERRALWAKASKEDKELLKAAADDAKVRVNEALAASDRDVASTPVPADEPNDPHDL